MLNQLTLRRAATLICVIALATITGAWVFEYFGYAPCELCLKQRWAYYLAIPLALATALIAPVQPAAARGGILALALIWFASAVFGIYHSGVEWKWWPGPDTCTGGGSLSSGLPDLNSAVVMCDVAAIRILGLSLAGWNAVISAALFLLAVQAWRRQGSSSVSQ